MRLSSLLSLALAVTLTACDFSGDRGRDDSDFVYVLTNDPDGNAVQAYSSDGNGGLESLGAFETGGDGGTITGTPDPLASQNALNITEDGRFVLAVNNGSSSLTSFRVLGNGRLRRVDVVETGTSPLSVDTWGDLVYVANNGADGMPGAGSVSGFKLSNNGRLTPIEGASQPGTDAPVTFPGSIAVSPDGETVVMTEKATGRILAYPVLEDGALGDPVGVDSPTPTPFGADFFGETLLVSEANAPGGMVVEGGSSASSWRLEGGALEVVSPAVENGETAACWIEATPDGRYAYTSNTPEASLSLYRFNGDGSLELLDGRAASLGEMGFSLDIAIAADVLYVLVADPGEVQAYRIARGGELLPLGTPVTGLVTGEVAGLVTLDR